MAAAIVPARTSVGADRASADRPRKTSRWMRRGAALAGLGLLILVVRDGSPAWQTARGLVVAALTASALVMTTSLRAPSWRGVVALAAGVVLAPVGLAVAGPHLAKGGPPLVTAAGTMVVVGGLVLLVTRAAAILHRAPRWSRVPAGLGIAAVAVVVASVVAPAVAATNVPRTSVGRETPADLGLDHRDVGFRAPDGVRLSGWYVPSTTGAAVALLHGAGSTRSGALRHAVVLARHGYGVLLYDARGHGRSTGRAMDFGWTGERDLAGALSFLARQPDVDPSRLGVVGLSLGGEVAIGASGSDARIAAVVAEGATARSAHDEVWLSEVHGWRGRVQEGIERVQTAVTDLLTDAHPPVALRAAVAASGRPTLLIAAGTVADEGDAARHIRAGAPGTVEVWTVDGADHTGGLATAPDEWERRVVTFLDTHL